MSNDNSGAARKKISPNNVWWLISVGMAETIGTGMLLFLGCMGGVQWSPQIPVSALQASLVFGIAVAIIIQIFGHISGAHLNPAVTVSAWVWGAVSLPTAALYVAAQTVGGILGYSTLIIITPNSLIFKGNDTACNGTCPGFCSTVPNESVSTIQALLGEYFATSILILLCCGLWDKRNAAKQDSAAIKFGLTIAALAMAVGPYTGCSMNPARTFAPALITGTWSGHWIYWVSPLTAGVLVTYFYKFVFDRDSQKAEADQSDIPLQHTNSKIQSAEKSSTEGLASI